jgi:hypothetical protein
MGWASGSHIFNCLWGKIRDYIPDNQKLAICTDILSLLEDFDCDTLEECIRDDWPEVAICLHTMHPDWEWDYYD